MISIKSTLNSLLLFSVILNVQHFAGEKIKSDIGKEFHSSGVNRLLINYEIQNLSFTSNYSTIRNNTKNYKSPWLAFGLSLFLPGMGQIYNGDYTKAAVQMLMVLGGGGLVLASACTECGETGDLQTAAFISGLGLASIGYIWSIFDAPASANNHNKQSQNRGLTLHSGKNHALSYNFISYQNNDFHRLSLIMEF